MRLRDGLHSTISERDGKNSKIDVNYLTDAKGQNIGHVEVMQDVTKTIRQQKYQAGEFQRLSGNLKNLSIGSLDLDLNVTEADDYTKELSQDYKNVNKDLMQVIEAISSMANDADSLVDSAIAGKLETRADASKHQGVYGKIIKGVNDTLDAVIGPLNVASKYMDDISKGAIPAKITDNYTGDFNVIKNNLNQCIDAVNTLVEDTGILSQAAVDGRLSTRADASKHHGDYRKIVQGVNDTLDAVIKPIEEAMRIADSYAEGDLTARVEIETKGDFAKLAESLDRIGESLTDLLREVNNSVNMVSST
jgi:methyl-accepting chemotaxis protein